MKTPPARMGTWRLKPPAAHMALGGLPTAAHFNVALPNRFFGSLKLASFAVSRAA